jgi:hypothetical protein
MSFFQENGFRVSTNHVAEFRAICRVAVWWQGDGGRALELGLSGAASALPSIWALSAQGSGGLDSALLLRVRHVS